MAHGRKLLIKAIIFIGRASILCESPAKMRTISTLILKIGYYFEHSLPKNTADFRITTVSTIVLAQIVSS
jgi:hypothetical protein